MLKLKNSAMLVVAALCGYLALMTPDWKSELSATSGVGYLPNDNYNESQGLTSDVVMRNTSTGDWTLYNIVNYQVSAGGTGALSIYKNLDYQYKATLKIGDGSGDVEVLTRQTSNGAWGAFKIHNGVVASTASVGGLYASSAWQLVGAGDLDADGDDDVLMRNTSTGLYGAFFFQNGQVALATSYAAYDDPIYAPQGMADLDSDGDDDLILRNMSTGVFWVAVTQNGQVVRHQDLSSVWHSLEWTFAFAADVNNDGFDDLVLRKTGGSGTDLGKWVMWQFTRNTPGDVRFVVSAATWFNLFYNPSMISLGAVGDYNGDGYTDVILRDTRNYWWLAQVGAGGAVGTTAFVNLNPDPAYVIQTRIN